MRQLVIHWLNRIAIVVVATLLLVFAADSISLRFRFPNNRPQFATMQVKPYYAVQLKNGKTEFMFDRLQDETCAYSLFPQLGYRPCWYVAKSKTKRIDVR